MARHRSSAGPLAWLYAALIVYASLSPFTGWKQPMALPLAGLGHLPWQRYWTAFDVVSNLLGYMPLGALTVGALVRSGRRVSLAFIAALLAGALLSFLMESLQNWLPQRVPSMLDWLLNAAGTLAGALVAVAVQALGGIERWQTLRDRWFVARSAGGLLLLLLWPVGLLFPTPVPLGLGQVLVRLQELAAEALGGTPWSVWTEDWADASAAMTPLSRVSELLTILLGLLAPCLVAYTIVRPGWRRAVTVPGAALLGFATTTLSTALNFGPQHALAWLTPPALPGLLAGAIAGLLLLRIPRRGAAGLGLVVVTALVALVAQAPTDPYYAESLQGWEQGRFIRFHGLAQWIGWLWPYAALVYLLARVTARDNAERGTGDAQAGP
ncbi:MULTISPECIES: VanZ family protein [unclassified Rhizobacter]|uniref:VanZ family protein n=1 Tax=unclassified Rhizobacter TaxID=2640088 RepID=UPI000700394D|nr:MULTISPECIES: VanZ family protein [unclassified Rhizobacter]KQU78538.1 teicoplanin resistance protein VanZ [Rhizobacter sp. Root29]KQW11058.1 teicoplanin resistance protein VanZ [Rhizobacter sp. Root1238]KRB25404.1 teicoplanin resistance protein VanZ [Rhizobacter sp. Root16D2]